MPIKDFPNSDAQLLQALQAAQAKANVTPAPDLAFSAATLVELNTFCLLSNSKFSNAATP